MRKVVNSDRDQISKIYMYRDQFNKFLCVGIKLRIHDMNRDKIVCLTISLLRAYATLSNWKEIMITEASKKHQLLLKCKSNSCSMIIWETDPNRKPD